MKTAIMQPYFLPYLGYFQLISAVDRFVVYDTIQYTKKGWINRNQMLQNGSAKMFTIPLQKASDYLDVRARQVAETFDPDRLCAQIASTYRKAPQFDTTMPLIEAIIHNKANNLFDFVCHSLRLCCTHLQIDTPLQVSSRIEGDVSALRGADRVIDICHRIGAGTYVNPPGGRALYDAEVFRAQGLGLQFLQPRMPPYPQFGGSFVPSLSILDVMMFNAPDLIRTKQLRAYDLGD
jgi:hypothetical protein